MRGGILVAMFFILTPLTLGISLIALISLSQIGTTPALAEEPKSFLEKPSSGAQVYASLPSQNIPKLGSSVEEADGRAQVLENYLKKYKSPLASYAGVFVEEADEYGIDYRLVVAIAQQESNLCKFIPYKTYNCWGWGIHSKGTLGFGSYEEGIETVTRGLRQDYLDQGYGSISDIMNKYTPQSNGSWAEGVTQFINEIEI